MSEVNAEAGNNAAVGAVSLRLRVVSYPMRLACVVPGTFSEWEPRVWSAFVAQTCPLYRRLPRHEPRIFSAAKNSYGETTLHVRTLFYLAL